MLNVNAMNNPLLNIYWNQIYNITEIVFDSKFKIKEEIVEEALDFLRKSDAKLLEKDTLIKVVVAGRMKSGKSLLTDVLFFDGEGILHSDVTPDTANITYIRNADKDNPPCAIITFITDEDIQSMVNYTQKQQGNDGKNEGIDAEIFVSAKSQGVVTKKPC